jgi:hypothetical protein
MRTTVHSLPRNVGGGLARQNQERGLEGIFGVMVFAKDSPADAPDHRTVAKNQRLERCFVSPTDKSFKQLSVREPTHHSSPEKRAKSPDCRA